MTKPRKSHPNTQTLATNRKNRTKKPKPRPQTQKIVPKTQNPKNHTKNPKPQTLKIIPKNQNPKP
jgi:hypothetical protein